MILSVSTLLCMSQIIKNHMNTNTEWIPKIRLNFIFLLLNVSLFDCTEQCLHNQERVLMIRNKEKSLKGQHDFGYVILPKYTVMRNHTQVFILL